MAKGTAHAPSSIAAGERAPGDSIALQSLRPFDWATRTMPWAMSIALTFSRRTSLVRNPQPQERADRTRPFSIFAPASGHLGAARGTLSLLPIMLF